MSLQQLKQEAARLVAGGKPPRSEVAEAIASGTAIDLKTRICCAADWSYWTRSSQRTSVGALPRSDAGNSRRSNSVAVYAMGGAHRACCLDQAERLLQWPSSERWLLRLR